jgi:hypothetical protein
MRQEIVVAFSFVQRHISVVKVVFSSKREIDRKLILLIVNSSLHF